MPLTNSQADGNVPFLPGRARYNVVSSRSSAWVFHKMTNGTAFDGNPPATDAGNADVATIDPTLAPGVSTWSGLVHGGLFTLLAHYGVPIRVEEITNPNGATITTVFSDGSPCRTTVPATPFVLAPFECLKVSGGTTTNPAVGFLVRQAEVPVS